MAGINRKFFVDRAGRPGIALVGNPDLAMNAKHAARILVEGTFAGEQLSVCFNAQRED